MQTIHTKYYTLASNQTQPPHKKPYNPFTYKHLHTFYLHPDDHALLNNILRGGIRIQLHMQLIATPELFVQYCILLTHVTTIFVYVHSSNV